jgi:hypothetical protein
MAIMVLEVGEPATSATSLNIKDLIRYICRYIAATTRYNPLHSRRQADRLAA